MKMSTMQEKAQCVPWFIETKSVIQVQRNFTRKYGRKPPAQSTIRAWLEKLMETGSVTEIQVVTEKGSWPTSNIKRRN